MIPENGKCESSIPPDVCAMPFGNLKLKLNSLCFWDSISLIIKEARA